MEQQQYEYRTGRTAPQKSHNGLIAVLLMGVIFLGGIVSALGLLNIHLFRQLEKNADGTSLSFSQGDGSSAGIPSGEVTLSLVAQGMTLQELPTLYQQVYDLPAGLYVCQVAAESSAGKAGIAPGDVLLCFAGTPVTTLEGMQTLERAYLSGNLVTVTVYRSEKEHTFTITVE